MSIRNSIYRGILVAATLATFGGRYAKANVNPTNTKPYFDVTVTMRQRGDGPGACESIITIPGSSEEFIITDGRLVPHDESCDDCRDLTTHYGRLPTSMRPE